MKVLDLNERKELWNKIDEASRKLGVMTMPKLHVGMKVEKEGIVLCDQREEGHSWTRNAWNLFFGVMAGSAGSNTGSFGAGYLSNKRQTGSIDGSSSYMPDFNQFTTVANYSGPNGDDTQGVQVGTGDTAFSVEHYTLASLIAHGTGSGQLVYNVQAVPAPAYNAGTWSIEHVRTFNNNSGDSITVKEVGLMWRGSGFFNYASDNLFARDVLGSPVAVAHGALLTVTYEISMDFSSIDT